MAVLLQRQHLLADAQLNPGEQLVGDLDARPPRQLALRLGDLLQFLLQVLL